MDTRTSSSAGNWRVRRSGRVPRQVQPDTRQTRKMSRSQERQQVSLRAEGSALIAPAARVNPRNRPPAAHRHPSLSPALPPPALLHALSPSTPLTTALYPVQRVSRGEGKGKKKRRKRKKETENTTRSKNNTLLSFLERINHPVHTFPFSSSPSFCSLRDEQRGECLSNARTHDTDDSCATFDSWRQPPPRFSPIPCSPVH